MFSYLALACLAVSAVKAATTVKDGKIVPDPMANSPKKWDDSEFPISGFNIFYDEENCDRKWGHACIISEPAKGPGDSFVWGCTMDHHVFESVTMFPSIGGTAIRAYGSEGLPNPEPAAVALATDETCASTEFAAIDGAYRVDNSPRHRNLVADVNDVRLLVLAVMGADANMLAFGDVWNDIRLFYTIHARIEQIEKSSPPEDIYGTIVGDAAYFVVRGASTGSFDRVNHLIETGAADDQVQMAIVWYWDLCMKKQDEDEIVQDRQQFWGNNYETRPSDLSYLLPNSPPCMEIDLDKQCAIQ